MNFLMNQENHQALPCLQLKRQTWTFTAPEDIEAARMLTQRFIEDCDKCKPMQLQGRMFHSVNPHIKCQGYSQVKSSRQMPGCLCFVQDYMLVLGRCLASLQSEADPLVERRLQQLVFEAMRLRGQYLRSNCDAYPAGQATAAQSSTADPQRQSVPADVLVSNRAMLSPHCQVHMGTCS